MKYEEEYDDSFAISREVNNEPVRKYELPDEHYMPFLNSVEKNHTTIHEYKPSTVKEVQPTKSLRLISSFARNAAALFPKPPTKRNNASRDAYTFSTSNPDEEWSTIPARKKMKLESSFRPTIRC